MSVREATIKQIETLPDSVLNKVFDNILMLKQKLGLFKDETEYINSIPGLTEKILKTANSDRTTWVSDEELWDDGL